MHIAHSEEYSLSLEAYQGPLHKLLELIEAKQFSITSIALAEVTADFLAYVERIGGGTVAERESDVPLPTVAPQLLADFLVVAAQLILIKSKTLLPSLEMTPDEETDIRSLEIRLRLYRELKEAQLSIKQFWSEIPVMAGREFLSGAASLFYPPLKLRPEDFVRSLARLSGELERLFRPQATIKREIIHLREKIEEVVSRLSGDPISFHSFRSGKSRGELVILFLAVLHLVKRQIVDVSQGDHFSDITIARRDDLQYNEDTNEA